MLRHIINALKGFLIGASNVIPGVSGGTMAVLTGRPCSKAVSVSSGRP